MSSMSLNDLTDVTISNLAIDQKIAYNGVQWVNCYAKVLLTYDTFFQGKTITITKGGSSSTVQLPSNKTEVLLLVKSKGEYSITYLESGHTYSASVDVVKSDELYETTLYSKDTINVTIYSAKGDTITYTDADNVEKTAVFDNDSASKVVTLAIIPSGISITFNSSIAYDDENYYQRTYNNIPIKVLNSVYYSKTVTVDKNTTEIYLMPSGALYWYGWVSDNIESAITSNGWTLVGMISSVSLEAPTFARNAISTKYATSTDKIHGVGTPNTISNKSSIVLVTSHITYGTGESTSFFEIMSAKQIRSTGDNILAQEDVGKDVSLLRSEIDTSSFSNFYVTCWSSTKAGKYIHSLVAKS